MNRLPPNTVLVNSQEQERIAVHPRTGETTPLGGNNNIVGVDATGGRHVREQDITVIADDGHVVGPGEELMRCRCGCGQTMVKNSTVYCVACNVPMWRSHEQRLNNDPLCPQHYPKGLLARIGRIAAWIKKAL